MKLFILKLLVFVLLLLAVAFVADYFISNILKRSQQGDYGVWNDLLQGKIDAGIIIHGSSRAWVQFNTEIIEKEFDQKAYNLGIDAYGFHMQYCRHILLMNQNTKPATIIQIMDYSMFDKGRYLYNPEQFLPYLHDSTITAFTSAYTGFDYFDKNIPYVRYIGKKRALNHAGKIMLFPLQNKPDRYRGFQGQHLTWNNDLENARKNLMSPFIENVDSAIVQLFRDYIERCIEMKIKLILVYPPEYFEGQDFVENRESILSLIKTLSEDYNLPYLDYSNHWLGFEKQYFYNSQHLNSTGANFFTRIFCHDLKGLQVIEGAPK